MEAVWVQNRGLFFSVVLVHDNDTHLCLTWVVTLRLSYPWLRYSIFFTCMKYVDYMLYHFLTIYKGVLYRTSTPNSPSSHSPWSSIHFTELKEVSWFEILYYSFGLLTVTLISYLTGPTGGYPSRRCCWLNYESFAQMVHSWIIQLTQWHDAHVICVLGRLILP